MPYNVNTPPSNGQRWSYPGYPASSRPSDQPSPWAQASPPRAGSSPYLPTSSRTQAPRSANRAPRSAPQAMSRSQQAQLAALADTAVMNYLHEMNAQNAMFGIPAPEGNEALAQQHFRRGFCGESCDAVLAQLQAGSGSTLGFSKVDKNHGGTHYFLESADGRQVIEPTWKQIVVSHAEEQADAAACAQALAHFPAVFVGAKTDLAATVRAACQALDKPEAADDLLRHWGIRG